MWGGRLAQPGVSPRPPPGAVEGSFATVCVRRRLLQQRCDVFWVALLSLVGLCALALPDFERRAARRAYLGRWWFTRQDGRNGSTAHRQRPDPQLGAPRAAAQRAVPAKSRLGLKVHGPERAGAPQRAARPRWRRRPPTHSQPYGPRKTARTHQHTRRRTRRDSESLAAATRQGQGARVRGHAITMTPPHAQQHTTPKDRTHTPRLRTEQRRPAQLARDQSRVSEDDDDIHVIKRTGKKEVVRYDKITSRIKKLCYGLDSKYIKPNVRSRRPVVRRRLHAIFMNRLRERWTWVVSFFILGPFGPSRDSTQVLTQKVIQGVYDGVTTHELDELAAQTAAYMATQHPDFSRLAARISVSNLHKSTDKVFSDVVEKLHKHVHPKTKKPASLIADDVYEVIMSNKDKINGAISASRGAAVPSRHRRDSCPSHNEVGGLIFDFEAVRTESSDRDAPRRSTRSFRCSVSRTTSGRSPASWTA